MCSPVPSNPPAQRNLGNLILLRLAFYILQLRQRLYIAGAPTSRSSDLRPVSIALTPTPFPTLLLPLQATCQAPDPEETLDVRPLDAHFFTIEAHRALDASTEPFPPGTLPE